MSKEEIEDEWNFISEKRNGRIHVHHIFLHFSHHHLDLTTPYFLTTATCTCIHVRSYFSKVHFPEYFFGLLVLKHFFQCHNIHLRLLLGLLLDLKSVTKAAMHGKTDKNSPENGHGILQPKMLPPNYISPSNSSKKNITRQDSHRVGRRSSIISDGSPYCSITLSPPEDSEGENMPSESRLPEEKDELVFDRSRSVKNRSPLLKADSFQSRSTKRPPFSNTCSLEVPSFGYQGHKQLWAARNKRYLRHSVSEDSPLIDDQICEETLHQRSNDETPKNSENTTSSSDGVSNSTEKPIREIPVSKSNPLSPRCNFRRKNGVFGALSLKGQMSKEGYCSPASQSSSLSSTGDEIRQILEMTSSNGDSANRFPQSCSNLPVSRSTFSGSLEPSQMTQNEKSNRSQLSSTVSFATREKLQRQRNFNLSFDTYPTPSPSPPIGSQINHHPLSPIPSVGHEPSFIEKTVEYVDQDPTISKTFGTSSLSHLLTIISWQHYDDIVSCDTQYPKLSLNSWFNAYVWFKSTKRSLKITFQCYVDWRVNFFSIFAYLKYFHKAITLEAKRSTNAEIFSVFQIGV